MILKSPSPAWLAKTSHYPCYGLYLMTSVSNCYLVITDICQALPHNYFNMSLFLSSVNTLFNMPFKCHPEVNTGQAQIDHLTQTFILQATTPAYMESHWARTILMIPSPVLYLQHSTSCHTIPPKLLQAWHHNY